MTDTKQSEPPAGVGYCLNCGTRITLCGVPFTLEVHCKTCGCTNVFENSCQPIKIKCLARGVTE